MECHAWEGPLSPDALLEQQLLLLRDFVDVPEDWILNVGVDEFLVYPKGLKYVDDLWLRASCCLLFRPLVYMSVFLSMVFLFSVKLNLTLLHYSFGRGGKSRRREIGVNAMWGFSKTHLCNL